MKKAFLPTGLVPIHGELISLINEQNAIEEHTLEVARSLAKKVLELFRGTTAERLLNATALIDTVKPSKKEYNYYPERTFLEVVLVSAIESCMSPSRFSCDFVFVHKDELLKAKLINGDMNEEEIQDTLKKLCETIQTSTRGFLTLFSSKMSTDAEDYGQFSVNCNFVERAFPETIEQEI